MRKIFFRKSWVKHLQKVFWARNKRNFYWGVSTIDWIIDKRWSKKYDPNSEFTIDWNSFIVKSLMNKSYNGNYQLLNSIYIYIYSCPYKCTVPKNQPFCFHPSIPQKNMGKSTLTFLSKCIFFCWIWLVGWLFGFYGISTFVGYLTPNSFSYK